jgi:hypothetical protein
MALSDQQEEFLNFLEQYWFEYGLIPTADRAVELGIPTDLYTESFKSAEFRKDCLDRGISLRGLPVVGQGTKAEWQNYMLTEEQLTIANVLMDITDSRSAKKKLQDMGISTAKYQAHLKDPGFQNYIRARSENALGDNQHEAHLALIDRVRSGDIGAIKYFNELTGRYVQARDSANGLDVTMILIRTLEIIQRFVTDAAVQEAIAQEFLKLSEPGALAPIGLTTTKPKVIAGTTISSATSSSPVGEGVSDL